MAAEATPTRGGREYFLLLLPLFFVLHGYTENYPLIGAGDALALLLQYILATALLCALFFLLFRSWRRTAIFVFWLMAFQFFFGSLHDAEQALLPHSFLTKYIFLLPLIAACFIGALLYFKRTRRSFHRLTAYLHVLLALLIIVDAGSLLLKQRKSRPAHAGLPAGFTACDSCAKPDVYFIVADEYAGQRELQDVFGFDNHPFLDALRTRGFHIMYSSLSNYNYTPFSTASILSMDYLSGIEGHNQSKSDRHLCYEKINRNPVAAFFRAQGYALRNFSVFQFGNDLPVAASPFVLTGKDLLRAQTFLSRLDHDIRFNLVTNYRIPSQVRALADAELASVEELYERTRQEAVRSSGQPRFIYSHLMMPHYPYFYDRNGNRTPPDRVLEGSQMRKDEYIGYLQYANKKYLELIDQILSHAQRPPVIIFMGDHGFRHFTHDVDHRYYFMNLDAVYLPGRNYAGFYPSLSAVNQFRILFNTQFGQHLPLLKDSTKFLTE